jgi:Flp pilus assembly protein TadG
MFSLSNRFRRDRAGSISIEFALSLPLLLLVMTGILEVGRVFYQAHMVERGLRSAALYASRNDWPLKASAQTTVDNLAKTSTADGSGGYVASGWADASANLNVDLSGTYVVAGNPVPIIKLTADIPFDPLLPGLLEVAGFQNYRIQMTHEQAYVGN